MKCRICKEEYSGCTKTHYATRHPEIVAARRAKPLQVNGHSPYDAIRQHEAAIQEQLLELDAERNRLSDRIKMIDDLCGKYRKLG